MKNDLGIGCERLCGECTGPAAELLHCDWVRYLCSIVVAHHGEVRPWLWPVGEPRQRTLEKALSDAKTFEGLFAVAMASRNISFAVGVCGFEWRVIGMPGLMVYRYADPYGSILPEARADFGRILAIPLGPRARIATAAVLAKRTLPNGAGFDVWDQSTGRLTRVGGERDFFPIGGIR